MFAIFCKYCQSLKAMVGTAKKRLKYVVFERSKIAQNYDTIM